MASLQVIVTKRPGWVPTRRTFQNSSWPISSPSNTPRRCRPSTRHGYSPTIWLPSSSSRAQSTPGVRKRLAVLGACILVVFLTTAVAFAQQPPPELTRPVNDFAGIIDPESARQIETLITSRQEATGDVVVVATIKTYSPDYGDIREYAVKMFENHGRGIGQKGKDNGLLMLVSLDERKIWIE